MYLTAISLYNFRLYSSRKFTFGPGVNAIYGPNGSGKTALLEAIYLLIAGRSFRTSHLNELLRWGANEFRIEALFVRHAVEQKLTFWSDGQKRRILYNGTPCAPAALLGIIQGGLLTPEDIDLIKGAPQQRRLFLDVQLAQSDPLYVHYLLRYQRALRQRNTLLRIKSQTAITTWEEQMAQAAAYIIRQRSRAIASLQLLLEPYALCLQYRCGIKLAGLEEPMEKIAEQLRREFERQRVRELQAGHTLVGPQRDDFALGALAEGGPGQSISLRSFGSEGQQRAAVSLLRLAQWHSLRSRTDITPLMLLDDLWLGLDGRSRRQQIERFFGLGQLFFSATEKGLPDTMAVHEIILGEN